MKKSRKNPGPEAIWEFPQILQSCPVPSETSGPPGKDLSYGLSHTLGYLLKELFFIPPSLSLTHTNDNRQ